VNRYVFKSRVKHLESKARLCKSSGSESQTVGPVTEKHSFQTCCCGEHVEQRDSNSWQIIDAGVWVLDM